MLHEITECEVCHSGEPLRHVMDLGFMPRPDDLRTEAKLYPTKILFCPACSTAHLQHQLDNEEVFPTDYHYRGGMTKDVIDGMAGLVADVGKQIDLSGKKVLDIGCNDGSLLDAFRSVGAETFGITPETAALEARTKGHAIINKYFTPSVATDFVERYDNPNVITFVNVFAHIRNLDQLLRALKIVMGDKTQLLVIENHYLGSVLERNQFDTFYHEHPRTYSLQSFMEIAERLGMHVAQVEFPARYGGNIRVFLRSGRVTEHPPSKFIEQPIGWRPEPDFGGRLVFLNQRVHTWVSSKQNQINRLVGEFGPLRCVAFPGRAAILMRLLRLTSRNIKAVYEKIGSHKIGHFVPATSIPILGEDEFNIQDPSPIINMAWHIPNEIEARWRLNGFKGPIIQAVEPADFT